jgi:ABC-2 type transport system ATP-binding protein
MIEIRNLTKRYGPTLAVDGLTFTVNPGLVTGFLGPNGAGKSTTMRMILGMDRPTSGSALVCGRRYADLPAPMRQVGALLDARAVHNGRTAFDHLLFLAQSNGIGRQRVSEVLRLVGLDVAADRRAGAFSLGMHQRLGIAAALFDEPINGLDPDGIVWIRGFIQQLAGEGRTVLISSHLMSEMAMTADHLIIIGRGKLIADSRFEAFVEANSEQSVLVRTEQTETLISRLAEAGADVETKADGTLTVSNMDSAEVGKVAAAHGIALSELTPHRTSLEDAFIELTSGSVEYTALGEAAA